MKEPKIKRCKGTPEQIGNAMKEGMANSMMLDRTFDGMKEKPVLVISPAIPGHEGRGLPETIPAGNLCTFYDEENGMCRLKQMNLPMHQCRANIIIASTEPKGPSNFPKLWKQPLGIAVVKLYTKITKPILHGNPKPTTIQDGSEG